MSVVAHLKKERLDPQAELAELTRQAHGDGAITCFVGIARPQSKQGEAIETLILQDHPTLTRQSLEEIAVECAERCVVSHVRVVHRWGEIPAAEPIVFAGAASLHRRAAF